MRDKVGYAIVEEEHKIKKKILPQNTVFSAEQSAIIGAIQSEKNSRHKIVIITDSLSTKMAAESRTPTKNPKTQTIRKMLDLEGPIITHLWCPSHKGIPGKQKANQAAKEALDEDIPTTERYPPDDLRPNMEKRKQRDERKEIRRRQKAGNKRNAMDRENSNIQTQNRVFEVYRVYESF
jgi:ribonuclease HI